MGVTANAGWLMGFRAFQLGIGVVMSGLVARYLGPGNYGLLNYALALCSLCGIWASLGLKSIVIRDLIREKDREDRISGTVFLMQSAAGAASFAISILAMALIRKGDAISLQVVTLCSLMFFFQGTQIFESFFESRARFNSIVIAYGATSLILVATKIALIAFRAPTHFFAATIPLEAALNAAFIFGMYRKQGRSPASWRFDMAEAKRLLREGAPLMFSAVAVVIYMRTDQIMIGQMLGDREVGIYSVAVKISEAGAFIPAAIASAIFPALIAAREKDEVGYYRYFQKFFDVMALYGVAMAVAITLCARWVVAALFGPDYAASADILVLHAWGGLFVSMGIACKHWFVIEGLQKYTLYRTLAGCVVNIALNGILIPVYGSMGAAAATVASQAMALFLFNGMNPNTRKIFLMQLKSLLLVPGMRTAAELITENLRRRKNRP